MKRVLFFVLALTLITLAGCAEGELPNNASSAPTSNPPSSSQSVQSAQPSQSETSSNSVEVDGIIYTINDVIYDNETITIYSTIENTTPKNFGYLFIGFGLALENGEPVTAAPFEISGDINPVVLAKTKIELTKEFSAHITSSEIAIISYNHMDYDEQFYSDFTKYLGGEITEEDFAYQYMNKMSPIEIMVPITST